MKKLFTLTTFVLSFVILLNSQNVANGGFESWSGGEPDDWTTSNISGMPTITQTNDSHSGSWALRGQTNTAETIVPEITSGYDNFGIPVSQNYDQLTFHYKYFEQGSDKMVIFVLIKSENYLTLGEGYLEIEDEAEDYTLAVIPITYSLPGTVAHAVIQILLVDGFGSGVPDPETYFIIDDLEFSGGSIGLEEFSEVSFRVFPNPATDIIHISSAVQPDKILIFNTQGQIAYNGIPIDKTTNIDISHLQPGIYFMQVEANGQRTSKKILIK